MLIKVLCKTKDDLKKLVCDINEELLDFDAENVEDMKKYFYVGSENKRLNEITVMTGGHNKYMEKYFKYKTKYLKLKSKLNK